MNAAAKELTVVERAKQALSIEHTEAELADLAGKYTDIIAIDSADDYALVKGACREFQTVRVAISKAGKAARDDANLFSKAVIGEERRLLNIVTPEEDRLKAIRKYHDDKAIREAAEKLRIETERKETIQERIAAIRAYADDLFGKSASDLEVMLTSANGADITSDVFMEFTDNAVIAKNAAVTKLTAAFEERKAFEGQRAEADRIAKDQAERQAQLDKQAEEQRKREAEAQAKIAVEQAEIRRQQQEIEDKKRAEEARRLAVERAEAEKVRLEKERLEREALDRKEAERLKAEQEAEDARRHALRPEKDRLIDWLKKLRFIDGIELHDEALISVQANVLEELAQLSISAIEEAEGV